MLRRRIPQSGHLMTAKRFWLQTVPSEVTTIAMMINLIIWHLGQDCDIVLAFPPDTPEATVLWLKERIQRLQARYQFKR